MNKLLLAPLSFLALSSCLTIELHLPEVQAGTAAPTAVRSDAEPVDAAAPSSPDPVARLETIVIDHAQLALAEGSPARQFENRSYYYDGVLLRMGRHEDFELVKDFMADADQRFELRFDGSDPVLGRVGIGGITVNGMSYAVWQPNDSDAVPEEAEEIRVHPLNEEGNRRWSLGPALASR